VIAHDSYLVNLGAPDEALRKKSVAGFIDELERCEALGVPWLVAHPGSHVGSGEDAGIATIAKSSTRRIRRVLDSRSRSRSKSRRGRAAISAARFRRWPASSTPVKENDRLRLCFDTEHAFASGYDISNEEGYQRTFAELDEHIGIKRIVAFHLNDSLKPFNSRIDRHEHIGRAISAPKHSSACCTMRASSAFRCALRPSRAPR